MNNIKSSLRTEAEIIHLANQKLTAAECLLSNGFYDEAYYIGGYVIELILKAKICKTLLIPDFFDFDNSKNRKLPTVKSKKSYNDNLYKSFKVHDYEQLLILSGLFNAFLTKIEGDLVFSPNWSVIRVWDESMRYVSGASKSEVESFIQSIKNIKSWFEQYL